MRLIYGVKSLIILHLYFSCHLVDRELIDLHLTLLRKLNFKSARVNGWEKYLTKFCLVVPSLESEMLQLERYGYLNTPVSTKLAILRTLCESQFDYNLKFKENVGFFYCFLHVINLQMQIDVCILSYFTGKRILGIELR